MPAQDAVTLLARLQVRIIGWVRQPSTIHGIGALLGVMAYAVAHVLTGDMTRSAGVAVVIYAAPHLLINDATAASLADQVLAAAIAERVRPAAVQAEPKV